MHASIGRTPEGRRQLDIVRVARASIGHVKVDGQEGPIVVSQVVEDVLNQTVEQHPFKEWQRGLEWLTLRGGEPFETQA